MKSLGDGLGGSLSSGLAVEPWAVGSRMNSSGALRDRFRGALLGLNLAPVALRLYGKCGAEPVAITGTEGGAEGLNQAILKAAVPKLLRYHDSWERRQHWIFSARTISSLEALSVSDERVAQVQLLLLGDFLEMALYDRALYDSDRIGVNAGFGNGFEDLTHLASRLKQYDLPAGQQQYYLEALAKISQEPSQSSTSGLVGAILSASQYPESYGLSVRAAAKWGGIAPAIAGLMAGARSGQSALPVLWQVSGAQEGSPGDALEEGLKDALGAEGCTVKCSALVAIADQLFAQWVGLQ